MKRTNSSDNRSVLGQIIKIEQIQPQICIPNTVNPPLVYQKRPTPVSGFGNGNVGQSQLTSTNPSLVSATRISQVPFLNTIPNAGNPPFMPQRKHAKVIGLGTGNVGHSQPALNPSVNQLESTNVGLISTTINTIDQPRLTLQMFPATIAAISSNDLETAMKIVGVKSIEELAYSIDVNGTTLLAYAAEYGRAKPIRILLSKVLDPQQLMQKRNNKNFTALMLAAIFGHAKAITTILQGVSNPQQLAEQWDAIGVTALMSAAINGHVGAITSIFSGVSNPQQLAEKQDNNGSTALMYAAFNGYVGVIVSIFSGVSNPQQLAEKQDKEGQTALFSAIHSYVSTLVITKILESVDDAEKLIFQINNQGLNSFTYALKKGNIEAALLLFDLAKDKASLLLKTNSPNQPAGIELIPSDYIKIFLAKYNGLNQ